jgi:hypothetical protein
MRRSRRLAELALLVVSLVLVAAFSIAVSAGDQRPRGSKVSFAKSIRVRVPFVYANGLAAGDLNGDGFADLVVVSAQDGGNYPYIAYTLGKGNGKFGAWQYGPATAAPPFVLLADATGDSKLDALTTDAVDSDITIAFGNGLGGFPSSENIQVGSYPLAVADVNDDRIPDIVGIGVVLDSVFVMLGEGNKQFGQPITSPAGGKQPLDFAVGDLNNDGIPDVVVANNGDPHDGSGANIAVLLGNGDGTFRLPLTYLAGSQPYHVVVGDFNGDGNLDVAVINTTNNVLVFLGNGDGTLQAVKSYPAGNGPISIATADFNGDGKLDIATADFNDPHSHSYVAVLLGNGDGTFQPPSEFRVGYHPWPLVVADFNHDGKPDIATLGNAVSILLNTTKFPNH